MEHSPLLMRGTYYYEVNSLKQAFLRLICFKAILLLDFEREKRKETTRTPPGTRISYIIL